MEGQAFLFTPMGAVPMRPDGTPLEVIDSPVDKIAEFSPIATAREIQQQHVSDRPAPRALPARQTVISRPTPAHASIDSAMKPGEVVKAARARAKAIRAELRRMKRLEQELAELDRLIAAAKQKPVALVRHIDHARHAR